MGGLAGRFLVRKTRDLFGQIQYAIGGQSGMNLNRWGCHSPGSFGTDTQSELCCILAGVALVFLKLAVKVQGVVGSSGEHSIASVTTGEAVRNWH
jgi:hypothetical protein